MSKTTLVIYKILVVTILVLIASGSVALVILSQKMTPVSTIELIEEKLNVDVEIVSQTEPEGEGYGELKLRIGEFSECLTIMKDGRVSKLDTLLSIRAYRKGELYPYGTPSRSDESRYTAWEALNAFHENSGWHLAGKIEEYENGGIALVVYVLDESFPLSERFFPLHLRRDAGKASLEDAYLTNEDVEHWSEWLAKYRLPTTSNPKDV